MKAGAAAAPQDYAREGATDEPSGSNAGKYEGSVQVDPAGRSDGGGKKSGSKKYQGSDEGSTGNYNSPRSSTGKNGAPNGRGGTVKIYFDTGLNAAKFEGFDGSLGSLDDHGESEYYNEENDGYEADYESDSEEQKGSFEGDNGGGQRRLNGVRGGSNESGDKRGSPVGNADQGPSAGGYRGFDGGNQNEPISFTSRFKESTGKREPNNGYRGSESDTGNDGNSRPEGSSAAKRRPTEGHSGSGSYSARYRGSDKGQRASADGQNGPGSQSGGNRRPGDRRRPGSNTGGYRASDDGNNGPTGDQDEPGSHSEGNRRPDDRRRPPERYSGSGSTNQRNGNQGRPGSYSKGDGEETRPTESYSGTVTNSGRCLCSDGGRIGSGSYDAKFEGPERTQDGSVKRYSAPGSNGGKHRGSSAGPTNSESEPGSYKPRYPGSSTQDGSKNGRTDGSKNGSSKRYNGSGSNGSRGPVGGGGS